MRRTFSSGVTATSTDRAVSSGSVARGSHTAWQKEPHGVTRGLFSDAVQRGGAVVTCQRVVYCHLRRGVGTADRGFAALVRAQRDGRWRRRLAHAPSGQTGRMHDCIRIAAADRADESDFTSDHTNGSGSLLAFFHGERGKRSSERTIPRTKRSRGSAPYRRVEERSAKLSCVLGHPDRVDGLRNDRGDGLVDVDDMSRFVLGQTLKRREL